MSLGWFTMFVGLLTVLFVIARVFNATFARTRSSPGRFESAPPERQRVVEAFAVFGIAIVPLGAGQIAGPGHRVVETVLLLGSVVAFVIFAVMLVVAPRVAG